MFLYVSFFSKNNKTVDFRYEFISSNIPLIETKKKKLGLKITHLNKMKPIDVTAARRTSSFTSETWDGFKKKRENK